MIQGIFPMNMKRQKLAMAFFQACFPLPILTSLISSLAYSLNSRKVEDFGKSWKFNLGDIAGHQEATRDDSHWRTLDPLVEE
jgi:hypothetical protein